MADYKKAIPVPNDLTKDYWEGAKQHRLVLKRCADCGRYSHPPLPTCPRCQSEKMVATPVSGKGTLYSYSVMRNAGNPGFESEIPYAVAIVELTEQKALFTVSNLRDCPLDQIKIGMPLEVVFEDVTPEVTLPQFRPARKG